MKPKPSLFKNLHWIFGAALLLGFTVDVSARSPALSGAPAPTVLTASDDWEGERFGTSVAIEGDTAVVGIPRADVGINIDAGSVYVYVRGGGSDQWIHQATLTAGEISSGFGRSVAINGDTIVVGAEYCAYVFVLDASGGWIRQDKLSPTYATATLDFGNSVDISDVWVGGNQYIKTIVVGDPSYQLSGAAYVFRYFSSEGWVQQTQLVSYDADPFGYGGDEFGHSVAIDGRKILVGAPGDDHPEKYDAGSVYGFHLNTSSGEWVQLPKFTANNPEHWGRFGESIDTKYGLAVIGAPGTSGPPYLDNSGTFLFSYFWGEWHYEASLAKPFWASGIPGIAVALDGDWISYGDRFLWSGFVVVGSSDGTYVFQQDEFGNWVYTHELTDGTALSNEYVASVAISGGRILVGAPSIDDEGENTGAAYSFHHYLNSFLPDAKLAITDADLWDHFGKAVAIDGDVAVIGVPDDDEAGTRAGAAYVFRRDWSGNWSQEAKLIAPDATPGDQFGTSVAVSGNRLVIGAPYRDTSWAMDNGRIYVLIYEGAGNWTFDRIFNPLFSEQDSRFGWSVDISGETIVVGMPLRTSGYGLEDGGKVEVFAPNPDTGWWQREVLSGNAADQHFGSSVAIEGDTILVGMPGDGSLFSNAGAVNLYLRDAGDTWNYQTTLTASDAAEGDYFGSSVSLSGDTVVVGAPWGDHVGIDSGSVYVFTRDDASNWNQEDKLTADDAEEVDWFGFSVAIGGDTILVGAPAKNAVINSSTYFSSGAAYFFQRAATGDWTQKAKLAANEPSQYDDFGYAVDLWGDTVLVGAPWFDLQGVHTDEGAAYLFDWEGYTPEGSGVLVRPMDTTTGWKPVSVYFPGVSQVGTTGVQSYDCTLTPPPGGLKLGDPPICYDLTTTAVFTPPAEVCIFYDSQDFDDILSLVFSHYNESSGLWETITPTVWDIEADFICGHVNSFSAFAIFEPASLPPVADTGGPYSVDEGGNVQLTGSGSDPEDDPLTFAWDLDDDGSFDVPGQNVSYSASVLDGPGTQTIVLRVCDDKGVCVTDAATVTVDNVAPTADFENITGAVAEGDTAILAFSSPSDPSQADTLAGFTYAYDCDGDGSFESGAVNKASFDCPFDDDGAYSALGRIEDKDGGFTDYTADVIVNNVAPTVDAGLDQQIYEDDMFRFQGSFSDPGELDTHTATIDWGDGSVEDGTVTENSGSGEVDGSHIYANPGVYVVTVIVTDDDGGVGVDTMKLTVIHGFLDFCLFAEADKHGVSIHQQAVVGCSVGSNGEVKIKKQALVQGNVTAGGDVELEKQASIEGNVTAAGAVELKRDATVTGTIEQGANVPPITSVVLSLTAGGSEVEVEKGGELTLDPDSYGALMVRQGATLNLRSGEYAFTEIKMAKGATINLNLGDGWIVINVVGDMTVHKEVHMVLDAGGSAADVLFLVAGDHISLHEDVSFVGTVLAPNAHIHVHKEMTLVGALYGRRLDIKQGVEVIGLPAVDVIVSMFLP